MVQKVLWGFRFIHIEFFFSAEIRCWVKQLILFQHLWG